jgi:hypothetical protein
MCVSREVSLVALAVAWAACLWLWLRNRPHHDRWIAMVSGYIGLMQLLEFAMWSDQGCGQVNLIATQLAFFQNLMQPVVSCMAAWWYCENGLPLYSSCLMMLWVAIYVPMHLQQWRDDMCTLACGDAGEYSGLAFPYTDFGKSLPADSQRLVPMYWTLFALALSTPFWNGMHTKLYCILVLMTCLMGYAISLTRPCDHAPTAGSWWCLLATIVPCVALVKRGALVHQVAPRQYSHVSPSDESDCRI